MNDVGTNEVALLRETVRVLAAGHGLAEGFVISDEVRQLAEAGRTVSAVKQLRRDTQRQLSLLAAKRMVDALHGSSGPHR